MGNKGTDAGKVEVCIRRVISAVSELMPQKRADRN